MTGRYSNALIPNSLHFGFVPADAAGDPASVAAFARAGRTEANWYLLPVGGSCQLRIPTGMNPTELMGRKHGLQFGLRGLRKVGKTSLAKDRHQPAEHVDQLHVLHCAGTCLRDSRITDDDCQRLGS